MARIGFFTLLFISLTIIARADIRSDIAEGTGAQLCRYTYPVTQSLAESYTDASRRHRAAIREIEHCRMSRMQGERQVKQNYSFGKISEYLKQLTPFVSTECDLFLVMGQPDEEIEGGTLAGFSVHASGTMASTYVYCYGYPQPSPGEKLIAKRFYFTSEGRPAEQRLDVLVTIEKETHLVLHYAFYYKDGIPMELWEEALLAKK
jgi:hypothetical protein